MLTAIIIVAGLAQILVSLFVLLRGLKNLSNVLFFLIGIATLCWAFINYLTIILLESSNLIYLVRFILFFVVIQNAFFYLFARTFPNTSWQHSKKWLIVYLVFTILVATATISPFAFTSLQIVDGLPSTKAGPTILVFVIHASFSIVMAFRALIQKFHRVTGIQKNQLRILLFASFLNWVLVPITNFLITPLLKTTIFVVISPIYTFAFASMIAYAIIAQKLFDIKAIIVRSVAYVLSLGLLVSGYALVSSLVVNKIFPQSTNDFVPLLINATIFLIAVILYPHIKSFFDKETNRIFYQVAYDPQQFLNQLNQVIVAKVDVDMLLKATAAMIEKNIKADYCVFVLRETSYFSERTIGTKSMNLTSDDIEVFHTETPKVHHRIIINDELMIESGGLKEVMSKHDMTLVARLVTTVKYNTEGLGYLILGPKKSGNQYNSQDTRILEIISSELVIVIQNALRYEEIENFNITLQQKVEDATRQLRQTNEKLKIIDETKDEFISMASHQLRTPLTSVKGYLSMVIEGDAGNISEMQRKLLEQAFTSSQRMVYLIADLLNLSRLKTGKFIIDTVPTDLAQVVEDEVEQLKETAASRNLTLTYNKPSGFPTLMLDETKIRQVIMNFTDNAIYYTPAGGHIELKLEDKGKTIEFTVNDDGIGIPKREQARMFTKFYRAGNAKKARPDGTGLGLFMVKKVIIAQGGSIIFKSVEGKGSTFGFSFDKDKVQMAAPTEEKPINI